MTDKHDTRQWKLLPVEPTPEMLAPFDPFMRSASARELLRQVFDAAPAGAAVADLPRYSLYCSWDGGGPADEEPDSLGPWVKFEDVAAQIAGLTADRDEWKRREAFAVSDLQRQLRERDTTIRALQGRAAPPTNEAALGRAIERAAGELPEDWMITIDLERGSGSVLLFDPEGEQVYFPTNHEHLHQEVGDAIDLAIEAVQRGGEKDRG